MEIAQHFAPLQAKSLDDLKRELEIRLQEQQQHIWQLRQLLEPIIKLNENTPNQQFNPLE